MSNRNQHGYVCPTENAAIWNADHPKKKKWKVRVIAEGQIRNQGVQKPEVQKQLESFNAFLDFKKGETVDDHIG